MQSFVPQSKYNHIIYKKNLGKIYPDVTYVNCGTDYQEAVCDADIIVTAISAQTDLLKSSMDKKKELYIFMLVGGKMNLQLPEERIKLYVMNGNRLSIEHKQ